VKPGLQFLIGRHWMTLLLRKII